MKAAKHYLKLIGMIYAIAQVTLMKNVIVIQLYALNAHAVIKSHTLA
jgi:hypothetical protein